MTEATQYQMVEHTRYAHVMEGSSDAAWHRLVGELRNAVLRDVAADGLQVVGEPKVEVTPKSAPAFDASGAALGNMVTVMVSIRGEQG